ncbi:hypothetical protein D9M71_565070 [compost metagenome]
MLVWLIGAVATLHQRNALYPLLSELLHDQITLRRIEGDDANREAVTSGMHQPYHFFSNALSLNISDPARPAALILALGNRYVDPLAYPASVVRLKLP